MLLHDESRLSIVNNEVIDVVIVYDVCYIACNLFTTRSAILFLSFFVIFLVSHGFRLPLRTSLVRDKVIGFGPAIIYIDLGLWLLEGRFLPGLGFFIHYFGFKIALIQYFLYLILRAFLGLNFLNYIFIIHIDHIHAITVLDGQLLRPIFLIEHIVARSHNLPTASMAGVSLLDHI